jgi:dynein heavy chain
MFGGLVVEETDKDVKANTCNELYNVAASDKNIIFTKIENKGDIPLKRACHVACAIDPQCMFVFGGYYDNKSRLNDVVYLRISQSSEYKWERPPKHPPVTDPPKNEKSPIGAPEPRADASCCLLGNKVYIFGGYGGINYQRKNFNDLYSYDYTENVWAKIEYESMNWLLKR